MSKKSKKDTRKIKILGNFSPSNHHGKNVYGIDGLCPTLCAGSVVKNGLNILVNRGGNLHMDKKVIEDNFTEIEDGKYVTTDKEGESCYAVTTRPRSRPLHKKQDNYVMEMKGKTIKLRESTKKGYKEAKEGDGVELSRQACSVRRGVSHEDSTGALNTQDGSWGTVTNDYRIRKLTPKECERLQAFPDEWTKYGKDDELISDTQRYKCCGNAVTTSVITAIVDEMFDGVNDDD